MDLRKLELHSDYYAIEEYVRRARLERSVAMSEAIASLIAGAANAGKGLLARIAAVRLDASRAAAVFARTSGF